MEQILINSSREEARVAILKDGLLQDLFIERTCARGLVGNVYWGQVVRVLPGMQSAFLDVGLERTAFLHIAEIEGAARKRARISRSKPSCMKASV